MKKKLLFLIVPALLLGVALSIKSFVANASIIGGFSGNCASKDVACQWYCINCGNLYSAVDGSYGPASNLQGHCACGAGPESGTANIPIEPAIIIDEQP